MSAGVTVGKLLQGRPEALGLDLELLAGSGGLDRRILSPYVQKTGLALAGFHEYLREGRVLVFGNSEVRYLESLNSTDRTDTMRKVCEHDEVPCILVTGGLRAFGEMIFEAERSNLPVLRTVVPTPIAMAKVTAMLEDNFVARELLHGVLLDIVGIGVLIVGESASGRANARWISSYAGLASSPTTPWKCAPRRTASSAPVGADAPSHGNPGLGVINIRISSAFRHATPSGLSSSCSSSAGRTARLRPSGLSDERYQIRICRCS